MTGIGVPLLSGEDAVKAFERLGWVVQQRRGKGSHIILTKAGHSATLSIPNHRQVKRGLLRGQIRKAGLSVEEYCQALR